MVVKSFALFLKKKKVYQGRYLIQLEITSRTKYDPTKQPAGIGRETIEQRLKALGANMKILSEGNLYHVQLIFT